jgi:NADH dehydrogenase [ubiquinone] 1 alpha subcomplex assembly factor 7
MSYDPQARRDTPLALKLRAQIAVHGPLGIAEYMQACLLDPTHGYYNTSDAIGRRGDFITAPEIAQVFGELIGLWCAVVWQQMGSPERIDLIELGPGRGTLMRDALRAIGTVPAFARALRVHLVEPSPRLRAAQSALLRHSPIPVTHDDGSFTGDDFRAPTILIGNEVLDCRPIDQLVRGTDATGAGCWLIRMVGVDQTGALQFTTGKPVAVQSPWTGLDPQGGDVIEGGRHRLLMEQFGRSAARVPLAALFVDYGHDSHAIGDTLQAICNHTFEHPLTSPGEADLSAQVDFAQVAEAAHKGRLSVDGPTTQAEFLGRLGIIERASKLMAANPGRAAEIETGVARLIAPNGMGTRFKAIGIRSPHLPPLPGF